MKNSQTRKKENISLTHIGKEVIISLNPETFPMNIVYSTSYTLTDKAFVVLDENENKEIIVKLQSKDSNIKPENLGKEFKDIINSALNRIEEERNSKIKDTILSSDSAAEEDIIETGFEDEGTSKIEENLKELEESSLEDPLGISEPWKMPDNSKD